MVVRVGTRADVVWGLGLCKNQWSALKADQVPCAECRRPPAREFSIGPSAVTSYSTAAGGGVKPISRVAGASAEDTMNSPDNADKNGGSHGRILNRPASRKVQHHREKCTGGMNSARHAGSRGIEVPAIFFMATGFICDVLDYDITTWRDNNAWDSSCFLPLSSGGPIMLVDLRGNV